MNNRLGVNIDHVATLRQARGTKYPDPVQAALLCEKAGASSIVCHLREDRRHIQDQDVKTLKKKIKTHLNLEMSIAKEIVDIALSIRPDQVTLVPERRQELTTEGGLDVVKHNRRLEQVIAQFHDRGIRVSLFINPVKKHIKASASLGADIIELHTGTYADAPKNQTLSCLKKIRQAAEYADTLGLEVSAGHGLDYKNIKPLTKIKQIKEYNIGHSIICQSVFTGIEKAVKDMVKLIDGR